MSASETLPDWISRAVDGDRPAVQVGGVSFSYDNLFERVEQAAKDLSATKPQPGDRYLVALPNSIEHIVALFAVWAVRGIAVPLDANSGRDRVARVAAETQPRLCFATTDANLPAAVPAVRVFVDAASTRLEFAEGFEVSGGEAGTAADSQALIRFTSGSTGQPKGVVLDHAQVLWTARSLASVFGLGETHRELMLAPMAFSGGWQRVASTLVAGGCVVVPEGPISVTGLLEDLSALSITGFFSSPPLLRALLTARPEKARAALAGCRVIEIGSASASAEELTKLIALAPASRIFVHYGLTECSRSTILDTGLHPQKLATVGRPAPGVEVEIRDVRGAKLGEALVGQIFVRGPQAAAQYWNHPDLSAERFQAGWVATGDYGELDPDGFLLFRGRRDDRIESGGYSFFPAEVEAELGMVEGVAEYLIAGLPDPRGMLGDVPWAFVVAPSDWSPSEFIAEARARLPAHMVPRRVIRVPSLPLTASGKPDRRKALELYARQIED